MGALLFLVFLRSQFGVSSMAKGFQKLRWSVTFIYVFKALCPVQEARWYEKQEGEERHLVTEANDTNRRTQPGKMGQKL